MSQTAWEMLAAVFVIVIVFMLVRPGSPTHQAVDDVSTALKNMLLVATGGTLNNQSNPGSFTNPVLPA